MPPIPNVMSYKALYDRFAGGGAIIHIGSIAADNRAESYTAASASRNIDLAGELGARDITSNVISHGR